MTKDIVSTGKATEQNFARIFEREPFQGLKAILDKISPDQSAISQHVTGSKSYEELLANLGYKLTLTRQIHVQDCYSRVGPAGGIKAVLPYYDISTQSSFPTLVNFDGTVTATEKSAAYFNELLQKLKQQLSTVKKERIGA